MTYLRDHICFPCFINASTHVRNYTSSIFSLMDDSILIFSVLSDTLLPPVIAFQDNNNLLKKSEKESIKANISGGVETCS